MNNKNISLIEKFKIALTSTARAISDDVISNKFSEKKKLKDTTDFEINDLTKPSDFIRLRAETDSAALKKNFLIIIYIKKIYPQIHHLDHFII